MPKLSNVRLRSDELYLVTGNTLDALKVEARQYRVSRDHANK
jgi:hypothetical protein